MTATPSSRAWSLRSFAIRAPLRTFFALAFVLTWILIPFVQVSTAIGLIALFGPAAAGIITARLQGPTEAAELRARIFRWRVPAVWYVIALVLPPLISILASQIERALGADAPMTMQPISPLGLVVFVLVIGEEIGWRGFALPRLLARGGLWSSSAILGLLWGLWHLPLFYLPGLPQYGYPFPPFVIYTTALTVLLAILSKPTGGSVILATLFHGAVNTIGVTNAAATPLVRGWGNSLAYGIVALALGAIATRRASGSATSTPAQ